MCIHLKIIQQRCRVSLICYVGGSIIFLQLFTEIQRMSKSLDDGLGVCSCACFFLPSIHVLQGKGRMEIFCATLRCTSVWDWESKVKSASLLASLSDFFCPNPGFKQFGKFPLKIPNRVLQNRVKLSTVHVVKHWEITALLSHRPRTLQLSVSPGFVVALSLSSEHSFQPA